MPAIRHASVAEAMWETVDARPERIAFRTEDDRLVLTWSEVGECVQRLGCGLRSAGLERGDALALMLTNRPEFNVIDLAAMAIGAVPFSIYNTSSAQQIAHVLSDSGARVAVVERQFADALRSAADGTSLRRIVVVDDGLPDELLVDDRSVDVRALAQRVAADDLVTLVYTSGTTGPPKGVEVTHANVLAAIAATTEVIAPAEQMTFISWLPAAHMAERMANHYTAVVTGATVVCCVDAKQILGSVAAHRPTWFFGVPRLWEKIKAGLEAMWELSDSAETARADLATALAVVRARQRGEEPSEDLLAAARAADARTFAALRAQIGLDRVEAIAVASAPCPASVIEFFHALGLPLSEMWGMSETTACGTINPPDAIRIGSVGLPAPGTEIRLGEDDEILVRGPSVMRGYRGQPGATTDAVDRDGWLHTGDVGAFDVDGYLRIVDRKKELIINSAGKNMSPANIEATLKAACPLAGHAVAFGDGRSYNVALIVLDPDYAPAWAAGRGLPADLGALAGDERVLQQIACQLAAGNGELSRIERVKRVAVLPGPWPTVEGQELTPTQKLRRANIRTYYGSLVEDLYAKRAGIEVES
jgi:long-subunit acyl-CoA synthetase (AMP-forming)